MKKRAVLALLFSLTLLGACGKSGGGMRITGEADISAADGAASSERGVWGGHQPMVAATDKGVYTAYFSKNDAFNALNFYRCSGGVWTRIDIPNTDRLSSFDSSSSVITLVNGDRVYIVSNNGGNRVYIWEYDETTGGIERFVSKRAGADGYISASIDPDRGRIYVVFSGGDAPGWLQIHEFDLAESTFALPVSIPTDYRYCYTYILPNADGFMISGGRDAIYTSIGYAKEAQTGNYAFDALGCWQVRDARNQDWSGCVDIAKEEFDPAYVPAIHNNYLGDALYASDGKTYFIYYIKGRSTGDAPETHYAVVENGAVSYTAKLFDGGMGSRLYETPDGTLWMFRMCAEGEEKENTRLTVFRADAERKNFSEAGSFLLAGGAVTYANQRISAPRGGTAQGYSVDFVYPTAGDLHWHYFRLELR